MTTEYSGGGDPRRSIELMWGLQERPRRGPKPKLTAPRIAEAAVAVADAEGLAAVSMRRLAEQLGVTAMSLYTYVPGKAELIDLMLDTVYGEVDMPDPPPADWRARIEHLARENRDLYLRHPWLLQVAVSRPPLGPNLIAKYDYELRALEGTGLSDVEMDLVLSMITDYVHGAARGALHASQAAASTGLSDQEWWERAGPVLSKVFDPARYPTAARVGAAAGQELGGAYAPERSFAFGLARLLDGVAALIAGR
ncbi:TetR/AcrR family transcriptional regulator [Spongiactinospora sp. TRM90649]|uniref:TetR/AcrR family transcriptional regulator n=1 Tax=Spongiactinospora sp. TRM90649 TaxID=3031114 RepID=UPI0023F723C0|nr:TetR/AcrR family transcriptional regulator [Spongiactinospora sp. TRM90649]MDF5758038.1 TetR/AcrR family transcriptional regulator [Spongiactinospora sp. TRM90649]